MTKAHILIVEDDKNISKLVRYNLEKAGYDCLTAFSGEEALSVLRQSAVDLIVLDVMLPRMDGFEVCRALKQDDRLKGIAVIMLTAKGEEVDRIVGLELGADDYIVKPFSPRELTLRIRAILKRGTVQETPGDIYTVKSLAVDVTRHKVTVGNKEAALTPMEFKLLLTLIQRQGRVQTRERLLSDVWDIAADVTTRTIDTHIKRLRKKIGPMGRHIETVRGIGYRFRENIG
ncbi:DNA-binding response regulator [Candidatus Velamenicoccus archaeovorus]|uniref:DNA-binding response regulator n=1 Tax=Velamenicoccus archaeovorus TaxID=1930593 RepID=A0A410P5S7_VELA1|nr:response regulator transcription factor [Candidatus Velamenicoccus archaeovorus]QAT17428.1 DNA-binding response regulator [Candidatus Velamenicoccus archaeovorus]